MTREEFLNALDALIAEKHLLEAPLLPALVAGQADAREPARVRDLLLPARGGLPDVRLGRPLGLRGRRAAAGAAREPDRGRARDREPSGPLAPLRGRARRVRTPTSPPPPRTPEVAETIAEFRRTTREGSVAEGLAALYAYESQIPEVSKTKREGLGTFYGIVDADATRFFSVHEEADVWHRQVEREALGPGRRHPGEAREGARRGAALLRRVQPRARRRDAGERARLLRALRPASAPSSSTPGPRSSIRILRSRRSTTASSRRTAPGSRPGSCATR